MRPIAMLISAALVAAGPVAADEPGQAEYMNSCAACHGEAGDGNGPLTDVLKVQVPDLTTLAARNDGTFPMLQVVQFVDGRSGVRAHGGPMPIWGDRYTAQAGESAGPYGSETLVRGRILSLVYYLESIQQ